MMAWFVYLKLDGMMVHHLLEDRRKKKKKSKRRVGGDIADYVDEHIVSFDELEEGEQTACRLAADLLAAALFLAASLIASWRRSPPTARPRPRPTSCCSWPGCTGGSPRAWR